VSLSGVNDVYIATERHPPDKDIVVRFNLVAKDGSVVTEKQPIQGAVTLPDGSEAPLAIATTLEPDAGGTYEIRYNPAAAYPAVRDTPGRFALALNAGSADDSAPKRLPIARAELRVNVGRGPYVEAVEPEPITCRPGEPALLKVTVGDAASAAPDTLNVRVFGEDGKEVTLKQGEAGIFSADVASLCEGLIAPLPCSGVATTTFRLRLVAQLAGGAGAPAIDRTVPVELSAIACTPTPLPTATLAPTPTPTPTPAPTPIPDDDGDGLNNLSDGCVARAQWSFAPFWEGCPPPWWALVLAGVVLLGLLLFVTLWLVPWLKVRLAPPPPGYVLVCREGNKFGVPASVRDVGMARRTNRVRIGSDPRRSQITVKGLKPVEFEVITQGDKTVLRNVVTGATRAFEKTTPALVSTSDPSITIKVALDRTFLQC
jgi:hypothetical protein